MGMSGAYRGGEWRSSMVAGFHVTLRHILRYGPWTDLRRKMENMTGSALTDMP